MTDESLSIDIDRWVDQTAAVMDLPLSPDHRPGVVDNASRIWAIAQLFLDFPLPETIEPAPVFDPTLGHASTTSSHSL